MSLITWSPNDKSSTSILSNGNLTVDTGTVNGTGVRATVGKSSGKWYWENTVITNIIGFLGVITGTQNINTDTRKSANIRAMGVWTGNKTDISTENGVSWGASSGVGTTLGVALDLDKGTIYIYKNGVQMTNSFLFNNLNTLPYPLFPFVCTSTSVARLNVTTNFGATPFKYPIPEGYLPYDIDNADWWTPPTPKPNDRWTQHLMNKYGVAWFKCDEEDGDVLDSKGTAIGVPTSITKVDDDKGGRALSFNGTDSYVQFNQKVIPMGKKSIYFEIKTNTIVGAILDNKSTSASPAYGSHIGVDGKGQIMWTTYDGTTSPDRRRFVLKSNKTINDNQWHRVLLTWDGLGGSNAKVYIDDFTRADAEVTAISKDSIEAVTNLKMGRTSHSGYYDYFQGQLKNIQIYNNIVDPIPKYSLVKTNNTIYTLSDENKWITVHDEETDTFKDKGILDLSKITKEQWLQLQKPIKILTWVDHTEANLINISYTKNEFVAPKLELTVDEYKPIMTLHEPEIITLTDADNPKLHIEGFRDLRPYCESENPNLLILSQTDPNIYTNVIPNPQLILPKGDIQFKMLDKVLGFNMIATEQNKGLIRIIFSVDGGNTWKVYDKDIQGFKEINIQDLDVVGNEGMTVPVFNSIGERWNDIIKQNKIRFGYYLKIEELEDVAEVDKLDVTIDALGSWYATLHEIDYDYEYDNEKIYVELYRDGSYKINYI